MTGLRLQSSFLPFLTGGFAFAIFAATLAPTFGWGDSADLALRIVSNDGTFDGTHRDYAFFRAVGTVFQNLPIGDAGTRANLVSAFFGAATIAAVVWFVFQVTASHTGAVAAGFSLTVAHSFWLLSVMAEVYTFNTALVFSTFALHAYWWNTGKNFALFLAIVLAGLALQHHATGLVLYACIAPLVVWRWRDLSMGWLFGAIAASLAITYGYWTEVFDRLMLGETVLEALRLKVSQNSLFEVNPLRESVKFAAYLSFNFLGPAMFLGFLGLWTVAKKRLTVVVPSLIWAAAFVHAGVSTSIPDKFNIYVMLYPTFAILVGIGVARFQDVNWISRPMIYGLLSAILMLPPLGYLMTIEVTRKVGIDLIGARSVPFRDNRRYFIWPPKNGDYGPRQFAERAMKDAPTNSILIADYTLWRPLAFLQTAEGMRPDLNIQFVERLLSTGIVSWIEASPCRTPVFLVAKEPPNYYGLEQIEARFKIVSVGSLFEVIRDCP